MTQMFTISMTIEYDRARLGMFEVPSAKARTVIRMENHFFECQTVRVPVAGWNLPGREDKKCFEPHDQQNQEEKCGDNGKAKF